jgi:NAD-dependent dihydropyrimidine dehydrogenase PreA subunit
LQNVASAVFTQGRSIPLFVVLLFVGPLLFSLFFGRVFCGAVCPLGAVQDLVVVRPLSIPGWLESIGRLAGYTYLGLAVITAAISGVFLVCRYDPFVSIFRFSGNLYILILGGCLVVIGLFVARPYCRFVCPYGMILRNLSRLARRPVTISPEDCINCGLCAAACPFGAIKGPTRPLQRAMISRFRGLFLAWLVGTIILILAGLWLGRMAGSGISRLDTTVQMAASLAKKRVGPSYIQEAVAAYLASGGSAEGLTQDAAAILARYRLGGALLGAWMGLVIGAKALAACMVRPGKDYYADPASCLACGRCFVYCPKEHLRRGDVRSDHGQN